MKRCAGQIRSLKTDQPSSRPPIDYRFYFLVLKTLTSQQYNYDLHFCVLLRNISSIDFDFSIYWNFKLYPSLSTADDTLRPVKYWWVIQLVFDIIKLCTITTHFGWHALLDTIELPIYPCGGCIRTCISLTTQIPQIIYSVIRVMLILSGVKSRINLFMWALTGAIYL